MTQEVYPFPYKPTINDIARVAGVSLATVDRVLNARPGVRQSTIERVNTAIDELGYVRDRAATNLARGRFYNFLFILPQANNEFIASLETQIESISLPLAAERTKVNFTKVAAFDPEQIANTINTVDPARYDGIAIFGPETPSVRDAVGQIKKKGLAVVTLVSDLPSSTRDHFVGIDNVSAGRTAAKLMGRFLANVNGKILVITGSRIARDHLERRLGFDQVIASDFPSKEVLPSLECHDDPKLVKSLLPTVFQNHLDISGIYSSAAGNEGLIRFIEHSGLRKKLIVIGHELTPISRKALVSGTFDAIISQDSGHLVRSAIRLLRAETDNIPFDPSQERIRIDIYLKENMPPLEEGTICKTS